MDIQKDLLPILQLLPEDILKKNKLKTTLYDNQYKIRSINAIKRYIAGLQRDGGDPGQTQESDNMQECQNIKKELCDMLHSDFSSVGEKVRQYVRLGFGLTGLQQQIATLKQAAEDHKRQLRSEMQAVAERLQQLQILSPARASVHPTVVQPEDGVQESVRGKEGPHWQRQHLDASTQTDVPSRVSPVQFSPQLSTQFLQGQNNMSYSFSANDMVQSVPERVVDYDRYKQVVEKYKSQYEQNKALNAQIKLQQEQINQLEPLLKDYEEKRNIDQLYSILDQNNNQIRISNANIFLRNQQLVKQLADMEKEAEGQKLKIQILSGQVRRLRSSGRSAVDPQESGFATPQPARADKVTDGGTPWARQRAQSPGKLRSSQKSGIDGADRALLEANQVSKLKMQIVRLNQQVRELRDEAKQRELQMEEADRLNASLNDKIAQLHGNIEKQDNNLAEIKSLREQLRDTLDQRAQLQLEKETQVMELRQRHEAEMMRQRRDFETKQEAAKTENDIEQEKTIALLRGVVGRLRSAIRFRPEILFLGNSVVSKIKIQNGKLNNIMMQMAKQEQMYQERVTQAEGMVAELQQHAEYGKIGNKQSDRDSKSISISSDSAQKSVVGLHDATIHEHIQRLQDEVDNQVQIIQLKEELLERKQKIIQEQQSQINQLSQNFIQQSQVLQQTQAQLNQSQLQLEEKDNLIQYQNQVNERQQIQLSQLAEKHEESMILKSKVEETQDLVQKLVNESYQHMNTAAPEQPNKNNSASNIIHIQDLGNPNVQPRHQKRVDRSETRQRELKEKLVTMQSKNIAIKAQLKRTIYVAVSVLLLLLLVAAGMLVSHHNQKDLLSECGQQLLEKEQKLSQCLVARKQMQEDGQNCATVLRANNMDIQQLNEVLLSSRSLVSQCESANKKLLLCGIAGGAIGFIGVAIAVFK